MLPRFPPMDGGSTFLNPIGHGCPVRSSVPSRLFKVSPCRHPLSSFRSAVFLSSPPAYPVRLPSYPTTLWQGMRMEIGLRPTAPPTARADIQGMPPCLSDAAGNLPVGGNLPRGDLQKNIPYHLLEG